MITEDYVSFEIAKLLKEKGFDEKCYAYWHEDEKRLIISQSMHAIQNITNPCFFGPAAPTHQMAMKWLREVHKILILVEYDCPIFSSDIYKMNDIDEYGSAKHISPTFGNCKSYEQAVEAALKYSLENLI